MELYSEVAKRINCSLQVVRKPKNRILRGLQSGEIDFYPGFVFNEERTKYVFFIRNGLPSKPVGLSRIELPEVNSYYDLKGKTLQLS
ncbi:hypothetical protein FM038_019320 [Shewanella eurypsychrophilus]|uniref:Solute-binding protein family 3/N-terminal domain-containing protein n=1 Tax=Shewanella eurypsychrophilus TaxID=2593656 RepID=A0ABX6VAA4_9GAMM|nr:MULTISPECIES: transporter substrate-binding domain-containing protein [Shewanella]QFU24083.1 hypothetical protein FS418_21050 [Shewanella sp. YLB-09]QPG59292.1 hypothetical protein FM038_019320 [Shewanella eurypsychrophilus]